MPSTRELTLASSARIRAEKVLLATGGRPRDIELPGADLDGVFTVRELDDAVRLESATGCGAAGSLSSAAVSSALRWRRAPTCSAATSPSSRRRPSRWHAAWVRNGVHSSPGSTSNAECESATGVGVEQLRGQDRVEQVELEDGTVLAADVVVVGVGMMPRTELAERLGPQGRRWHCRRQARLARPIRMSSRRAT